MSPLPHQPCQPLLPTGMSLELFPSLPSHLGLISGLTHPISPHISLFLELLLIRKARENPRRSRGPTGEQEKGTAKKSELSLTWRSQDSLDQETGKPWITGNFFWGFADLCVSGFSVFRGVLFCFKGQGCPKPWGSFFTTVGA